jgi:hypothetical protein
MCPTTFRSNHTVYATAVSSTKSVSADLIAETRMKVPMLNDCYPFSTDVRRGTLVKFRLNLPVRYEPKSRVPRRGQYLICGDRFRGLWLMAFHH